MAYAYLNLKDQLVLKSSLLVNMKMLSVGFLDNSFSIIMLQVL